MVTPVVFFDLGTWGLPSRCGYIPEIKSIGAVDRYVDNNVYL